MTKTPLNAKIFDRCGGEEHRKRFNVGSYARLTMMVARVTGCEPAEFVHTFGDAHLYLDHLKQADRRLARDPIALPRVRLHGERRSLFDFRCEDVELLDYRHHPAVPAPVSA